MMYSLRSMWRILYKLRRACWLDFSTLKNLYSLFKFILRRITFFLAFWTYYMIFLLAAYSFICFNGKSIYYLLNFLKSRWSFFVNLDYLLQPLKTFSSITLFYSLYAFDLACFNRYIHPRYNLWILITILIYTCFFLINAISSQN